MKTYILSLAFILGIISCSKEDSSNNNYYKGPGNSDALIDENIVNNLSWDKEIITTGMTLKTTRTSYLYLGAQTISMLEIDLNEDGFKGEIRVATPDPVARMQTSVQARNVNAIAAINGTYFNTITGVNRHFVKVNHVVKTQTEKNEFSTRASGAILLWGKKAEIIKWDETTEKNKGGDYPYALVSGPILISDNKFISLVNNSFNSTKEPRSCIAITKENKLLFIILDGRHSGKATGVTLSELRSFALQMGAKDALNVDGGGSSTLYVRGVNTNGIVNYPCDNKTYDHLGERAVASTLLVIQK